MWRCYLAVLLLLPRNRHFLNHGGKTCSPRACHVWPPTWQTCKVILAVAEAVRRIVLCVFDYQPGICAGHEDFVHAALVISFSGFALRAARSAWTVARASGL